MPTFTHIYRTRNQNTTGTTLDDLRSHRHQRSKINTTGGTRSATRRLSKSWCDSRSFHHTWQVPRNMPSNQMFLHVKELRGSGDVLRKFGHPQRVYSTGEVFFVQSEALLCAHASTKRSVIEAAAKLGQGHRLAKDAKMQTHIHKTVCENEYSTLLLVKVPVALHIDLSFSPGLRCPPLIVLCRPGISVLTSSSAFSLFHGTYSCVMISMGRRTSVLRMKIAAWRSSCIVESSALARYNGPTRLHPGQTGWFHDGLESPRWSSHHVPGAPQRH